MEQQYILALLVPLIVGLGAAFVAWFFPDEPRRTAPPQTTPHGTLDRQSSPIPEVGALQTPHGLSSLEESQPKRVFS